MPQAYFLPTQGRTNSVVTRGPPVKKATACACSLPSGHLAVRMLRLWCLKRNFLSILNRNWVIEPWPLAIFGIVAIDFSP